MSGRLSRTEQTLTTIYRVIEFVGGLGDQPGDTEELRLQRRFLIVTGVVMSVGGLLWGILALAMGFLVPSLVPLAYVILTFANFVFLAKTKYFEFSRSFQVLISITLPFVFQWGLGGLIASGGAMLWSMLCLSAAQSFESRRASLLWLALFILLAIVSAIFEYFSSPPVELIENRELLKLPLFLFMFNFLAVSLAIFGLISYFMHLRRNLYTELAKRNNEIAESQQALVQSEKLAALGRLSAGMAHELNNPAAAAARGAKHLRKSIREGWKAGIELGEIKLSQEQAALLVDLERRIERELAKPTSRDALERADLEQSIDDFIYDKGLVNTPDPAMILEAGIDPETLAELNDAFPTHLLPVILRLIVGLFERESLAEQVTQGTERISILVQTLKSYTYMDRSEAQIYEVNAGLNDTLIMLRGALKRGIEVERDLDPDLPCIQANGGELNQVWTNLISNAADAMDGVGKLWVSTRMDNNSIVVVIRDSGPGIPEKIKANLFEPFVTTKPVGEGTGLGLNISRSIIVEKHGGSISVDSEPGRTEFEVRLPLNEVDCPPEMKR